MLDGYHRSFNVHALDYLTREVDIPDLALGVGWAESLRSEQIRLVYEPVARTAVITNIRTNEDAGVKGQGNQVPLSRFPNTGYLGEALGGW